MGDEWLDPLRAALDQAAGPVTFFFRDDDAGWDDERLLAMLDVVQRRGLPMDLAIIPRELGARLAATLTARAAGWEGLGLHQHGLAHANREPSGRKCEFGVGRDFAAQHRDIAEGRELLENRLGGLVEPVFTPPWNRCTPTTGAVLRELGFRVLSRHISEAPLRREGLDEVDVSVDWTFAKRDGRRLSRAELGVLAAERARSGAPVGVNLHHAVMDGGELDRLGQLCDLLADHPAARCRPLGALA